MPSSPTPKQPPSTSTHSEHPPLRLVGHIFRAFSRVVDTPLRELGFAVGQVPVLLRLKDQPAMPQSELARAIGVEQPSMAQLLARMERDGLIERTQDPEDGRSRKIKLTKYAMTQMPKARTVMEKTSEAALAGLSPEERTTLTTLLLRVATNLEKMQEQGE